MLLLRACPQRWCKCATASLGSSLPRCMLSTGRIESKPFPMRSEFEHAPRQSTHWFPGHMQKAFRLMQERLKDIDVVIEVHDARIPLLGRNHHFNHLAKRPRILVLNKADLAEPSVTKYKKRILGERLPNNAPTYSDVVLTSCASKRPRVPLLKPILRSVNRDSHRDKIRVLIAGMPNVGKSSLINALRSAYANKKHCARTGPTPGVTRAVQMDIKICEDPEIYVVDTPGIMIPNIRNQNEAMILSLMGTLRDEVVGEEHAADFLLYTLNRINNFSYVSKYRMDAPTDNIRIALQSIAHRLGHRIKGGEYDTYRAACAFLRDFRTGKLGPVLLESDSFMYDAPPDVTSAVSTAGMASTGKGKA